MARASLDLIEAMRKIAKATQPITGRGIGYKLFSAGLIPSMGRSDMQRVYRLLKRRARKGIIPWDWIVDETRELERVTCWDDPAQYARCRRARRTVATSGTISRSASRFGPKRAPCAASSSQCSTSMRSASASCTASAARQRIREVARG